MRHQSVSDREWVRRRESCLSIKRTWNTFDGCYSAQRTCRYAGKQQVFLEHGPSLVLPIHVWNCIWVFFCKCTYNIFIWKPLHSPKVPSSHILNRNECMFTSQSTGLLSQRLLLRFRKNRLSTYSRCVCFFPPPPSAVFAPRAPVAVGRGFWEAVAMTTSVNIFRPLLVASLSFPSSSACSAVGPGLRK